jgi:hypothetical protein
MSSLVRPRLRLFGRVGAPFMCVLPPREGWRGARRAIRDETIGAMAKVSDASIELSTVFAGK